MMFFHEPHGKVKITCYTCELRRLKNQVSNVAQCAHSMLPHDTLSGVLWTWVNNSGWIDRHHYLLCIYVKVQATPFRWGFSWYCRQTPAVDASKDVMMSSIGKGCHYWQLLIGGDFKQDYVTKERQLSIKVSICDRISSNRNFWSWEALGGQKHLPKGWNHWYSKKNLKWLCANREPSLADEYHKLTPGTN